MRPQILSLTLSGAGVCGLVMKRLLHTAVSAYLDGQSRRDFADDHCTGAVVDTGRHAMMGYVGGRIFEADVSSIHGQTHTTFLISSSALEPETLEMSFQDMWLRAPVSSPDMVN